MQLSTVWNSALAKQPLNWAVVWIFATIWLLACHVVMSAFGAMSGQPAISAGPGTVAIPPNGTGVFSQGGVLAGGTTMVPPAFFGGGLASGDGQWPSDAQGRWAEDNYSD